MQPKTYNKHGIFSDQKISVDQAMKTLRNKVLKQMKPKLK
ncbi:hypothetical protein FHW36_10523 [Chitinophaga polysaccharea]|uniref:Uncharacterized protein n=1 Tax=Chitinophaga polysaccharea TaxID=1293035 RepID=A0A561PNA1_9BACT|nr:hypothetical protein FHW36_10523 [Chitinophaga polysaccharea]